MTDPSEDAPITLAEAASGFFNNKLTPASLRAESRRGSLKIYRIGRRDFTTVRDLKEMLACRVVQPVRAFTLTRGDSPGLSETDQHFAARAAALEAVEMLKSNSRSTSGANTGPRRPTTRS